MRGVKQVKESTGRGKKHRYSNEFKVTAVKMASSPDVEVAGRRLRISPKRTGISSSRRI